MVIPAGSSRRVERDLRSAVPADRFKPSIRAEPANRLRQVLELLFVVPGACPAEGE
jgi:hypothetical protein